MMNEKEYRAHSAMNQSFLQNYKTKGYRYAKHKQAIREDKKVFLDGHHFHGYLLEGYELHIDEYPYFRKSKDNPLTAEQQRLQYAMQWEEDNPGKFFVTQDEANMLKGMKNAVYEHEIAAKHLRFNDVHTIEESSTFDLDIGEGDVPIIVQCKMKMDYCNYTHRYIVDLKSMANYSLRNIEQNMKDKNAIQAAFYILGMMVKYGELFPFLFIYVDKEDVHSVSIQEVSDRTPEAMKWLEYGMSEVFRMLREIYMIENGQMNDTFLAGEMVDCVFPSYLEKPKRDMTTINDRFRDMLIRDEAGKIISSDDFDIELDAPAPVKEKQTNIHNMANKKDEEEEKQEDVKSDGTWLGKGALVNYHQKTSEEPSHFHLKIMDSAVVDGKIKIEEFGMVDIAKLSNPIFTDKFKKDDAAKPKESKIADEPTEKDMEKNSIAEEKKVSIAVENKIEKTEFRDIKKQNLNVNQKTQKTSEKVSLASELKQKVYELMEEIGMRTNKELNIQTAAESILKKPQNCDINRFSEEDWLAIGAHFQKMLPEQKPIKEPEESNDSFLAEDDEDFDF